MTERNELLKDPHIQRVVNLLGQRGWKDSYCANMLRELAEWYQPSDRRRCEYCCGLFSPRRRDTRFCNPACRQASYRRKRNES